MKSINTLYRPPLVVIFLMVFFSSVSGWASTGKINGQFYETKGRCEAIVLLHGGQLDRRMWDAQFDAFAKHFRVIRYDLRGFGKSATPDIPFSNEEDLVLLLQRLRVKRATLVGLSLGAAVAVDFALAHPDMVEALILACPGLGGFRFEDKANDLHAVIEAAQEHDDGRVTELWLANPYMSVAMENPALQQKLRLLARDNARCWLNNPLLVRRSSPPASQRLREIRAPTLVIGGERDVSDIHKIVAKLVTEIPGARKEMIPQAGHIVPMERPEEFNRLVLEFIQRLSRN